MYLASIMTFDDSFSETPQDFNESSTYGDYTDFTLPNSTFNTSNLILFIFRFFLAKPTGFPVPQPVSQLFQ